MFDDDLFNLERMDAEELRRLPIELPGQSAHALELPLGAERAAELGFPETAPTRPAGAAALSAGGSGLALYPSAADGEAGDSAFAYEKRRPGIRTPEAWPWVREAWPCCLNPHRACLFLH